MAFFQPEFASTLQYFTFPLEVIGLTLATIEVRFPSTTRSIASLLSKAAKPHYDIEQQRIELWEPVEKAWNRHQYVMVLVAWWAWFYRFYSRRSLFGGLVLYFFVTIGFILLLLITGLVLAESFQQRWFISSVLWNPYWIYIWSLGFPVYALITTVTSASAFVERFVEGRAVGTLGIFIAGMGVAGEAYQFTTQLLV